MEKKREIMTPEQVAEKLYGFGDNSFNANTSFNLSEVAKIADAYHKQFSDEVKDLFDCMSIVVSLPSGRTVRLVEPDTKVLDKALSGGIPSEVLTVIVGGNPMGQPWPYLMYCKSCDEGGLKILGTITQGVVEAGQGVCEVRSASTFPPRSNGKYWCLVADGDKVRNVMMQYLDGEWKTNVQVPGFKERPIDKGRIKWLDHTGCDDPLRHPPQKFWNGSVWLNIEAEGLEK
jgi:hypothetical protein